MFNIVDYSARPESAHAKEQKTTTNQKYLIENDSFVCTFLTIYMPSYE